MKASQITNTSPQSAWHHSHATAKASFKPKKKVWTSQWSVILRTFYRQILSLLYSSFFFWNFRHRLARELLVFLTDVLFLHVVANTTTNYLFVLTCLLSVFDFCGSLFFICHPQMLPCMFNRIYHTNVGKYIPYLEHILEHLCMLQQLLLWIKIPNTSEIYHQLHPHMEVHVKYSIHVGKYSISMDHLEYLCEINLGLHVFSPTLPMTQGIFWGIETWAMNIKTWVI